MYNPLDDVYREYKEKKMGTHGVTKPIFDSELEPDYTKTKQCSECGSFSVSVDMSTNKTICNKCNKEVNPKLVDFSKKIEKIKEDENNVIEKAIKRGVTFG